MNIRRFESYPRLSSALTLTFLLCGMLLVLLLLSKIAGHVTRFENRVEAEFVERGADGVALALGKSIEGARRDLNLLAAAANANDVGQLKRLYDALDSERKGVSWVGFADTEGRLVYATDGSAGVASVEDAPWFYDALVEGTSSDLGTRNGNASDAVLTLARSVEDHNGNVSGVISMSLDKKWMADLVSEAAEKLRVRAAIVGNGGDIVFSAEGLDDPESIQGRLQSVFQDQAALGIAPKVLRDGERILALRPQAFSSSVPNLQWHLITWSSTAEASGSAASFAQEISIWIIVALGVATIVPIVLVIHFVRPLEKLANTARKMADGVFEFPVERCFTREAAMLSAALSRLQTQLAQSELNSSEVAAKCSGDQRRNDNVRHLGRTHPTRLMRRLSRFT